MPVKASETRAMLAEIYSQHAPDRLGDIDSLLEAYAGQEEELVDQMKRKYLSSNVAAVESSQPPEPPELSASVVDEGTKLRCSKRRYLRALLINAEVKKMLRGECMMLPQEVLVEATNRMARVEAAQIVDQPLPGGCDKLMGLGSLCSEAPQPQALQVYLIPALEKRLLDKCRCLAQFYHHEEEELLSQLPRQVQDMVNRIQALRSSNIELEERIHQSTSEYTASQVKLLQSLSKCINEPKREGQEVMARRLTELTEFLTSIELKLKLTKTQLLSETYTKQTIPALLCIRTVLDKQDRAAQRQSTRARGTLREYSACGDELQELAREYRATQEMIADKKQQLSYLVANSAESDCC
jgi:hypothetical protein